MTMEEGLKAEFEIKLKVRWNRPKVLQMSTVRFKV